MPTDELCTDEDWDRLREYQSRHYRPYSNERFERDQAEDRAARERREERIRKTAY